MRGKVRIKWFKDENEINDWLNSNNRIVYALISISASGTGRGFYLSYYSTYEYDMNNEI